MRVLKFLLINIIFLAAIFMFGTKTFAAKNHPIYINFFFESSADHTQEAENFLNNLSKRYDLVIKKYDLSQKSNRDLLKSLLQKYQINSSTLPVIFIGEQSVSGFVSPETSGVEIENIIKQHVSGKTCVDAVKKFKDECQQEPQYLKVPFLGEVNLNTLSLPALTVILGTLDGFNPCSMWALLALLALLIATKSRKKLIVLGGLFIFISSVSYFLFMTAWLKLFQWISFIEVTKIIIGVGALVASVYYFRDWWIHRPGCKVTSSKTKARLLKTMDWVIHEASIPAAVLGIIFLAFSVNLIEMICTVGLPAIFTRVLSLQNMSNFSYYLYIIVYVFFYMLLNLIVYFVAIATFSIKPITTKYNRYMSFLGAVVMVILGVYLLFFK